MTATAIAARYAGQGGPGGAGRESAGNLAGAGGDADASATGGGVGVGLAGGGDGDGDGDGAADGTGDGDDALGGGWGAGAADGGGAVFTAPEPGSTIRDDSSTASNAPAGIRLSSLTKASLQRSSADPWKYQSEPLSARIRP